MANSILRNIAHNSFADGIYTDLTNRTTRYYHYFGKVATWLDETVPYQSVDSANYERSVRNEIVVMKEIAPSDVAYIIPRIDWTSGTVYDRYDDSYSDEIRGINLSAPGTGYTSPIVTIGIEPPLVSGVALGDQYYHVIGSIGYLYTVTEAGITGPTNDILGSTIGRRYIHGTAYLTCVGYQATATATLGTSANISKIVSVQMTYNGSGYSKIPSVTITGGSGVGAACNAVMVTGKTIENTGIVSYKLEDTNYYVYNPTESAVYVCVDNNNKSASTVIPTGTSETVLHTADGYLWKYMYSLTNVTKFITADYLPVVTANKNTYTPVGSIAGVSIDSGGTGYTGTTTITVNGDGVGASLVPQTTNGVITGVTISNPGSGYTYANLVLSTNGTGGSVSPWIFSGTVPTNSQFISESKVTAGTLAGVEIISGGYGYTTASVSFIGDGTGAVGSATIVSGRITKISLYDTAYRGGSGYNWANVVITGDGYGASARAIISPYGGLGKDPINQLCAKSLMFYSNLSNNFNQGISQTNEYRQIGIIKDPVRYSDKLLLKSNFASCCWKISTLSAISNIVADDIVTSYSNSTTYSYRVVYVSGTNILILPIDNGIPTSNMQFTKVGTVYSFSANSVLPPSVDKYSGDLMIIDNESAFTPSSAVVRTIINF